jgi:hypothetical protein
MAVDFPAIFGPINDADGTFTSALLNYSMLMAQNFNLPSSTCRELFSSIGNFILFLKKFIYLIFFLNQKKIPRTGVEPVT